MRVLGVDGTNGGWVGIILHDGAFAGDRLFPMRSAFADVGEVAVIAVDIPIGFGPNREADMAARKYLTGAASTVFSTPSRAVLEVPFGPGLGVSAQAHALGPRILHITELAESDSRIYEVHPEVSFRAMNGGTALRHKKKSAGGVLKRLSLLVRHGIELSSVSDSSRAAIDDVLDAAAAAWSAHRIATGAGETLPPAQPMARERIGAIWY